MEQVLSGCGTHPGYQAHRKRGEDACEACKAANREYMNDWMARNPEKRAAYKQKAVIRDRALERLAREYPERFMELYFEEEARSA
jgi:hypothetical protein